MKELLYLGAETIRTRQTTCRVPEICPMETFHFIMIRERARVDRSQGVFSLVVFDMEQRHVKCCRKLVDVIMDRMRVTDSVGWFSPGTIGVLLVDTPQSGGRTFLQSILQVAPPICVEARCHVYTYPMDDTFGSTDKVPEREIGVDADPCIATLEKQDSSIKLFNEALAIQPSFLHRRIEQSVALIALVICAPLMMVIALSIKFTSPGPVLFRQLRVGHGGRSFVCYKFRSMQLHADTHVHDDYFKQLIQSDRPMKKLDSQGDSRIFPVGKILRASSLDELPQLFNIFKGEMSLIGPRPSTPGEFESFLPWQRHRVDSLPGLTGLWQVSGKNKTSFIEMIRLDLRYNQQRSLKLDLRIIAKTIPVVIGQLYEHCLEHYSLNRFRLSGVVSQKLSIPSQTRES